MDQISAYKTVVKQGSSLVIIATKELSQIGIMKGDTVKVTFERVDDNLVEPSDEDFNS